MVQLRDKAQPTVKVDGSLFSQAISGLDQFVHYSDEGSSACRKIFPDLLSPMNIGFVINTKHPRHRVFGPKPHSCFLSVL